MFIYVHVDDEDDIQFRVDDQSEYFLVDINNIVKFEAINPHLFLFMSHDSYGIEWPENIGVVYDVPSTILSENNDDIKQILTHPYFIQRNQLGEYPVTVDNFYHEVDMWDAFVLRQTSISQSLYKSICENDR